MRISPCGSITAHGGDIRKKINDRDEALFTNLSLRVIIDAGHQKLPIVFQLKNAILTVRVLRLPGSDR